jgi:nicotinamidase-related amidase
MISSQKDYAARFSLNFKPVPEQTALLIIDMQYASAHRDTGLGRLLQTSGQELLGQYRFERIEKLIIPNIQKLLGFFRDNKLRVIFITVGSEMQDYSDLPPHMKEFARCVGNNIFNREHDILDELKPLPGELRINKRTMSAFNSSPIDLILKTMGIRYVLCCGVSTNSCVEGTARDAAEHGYYAVIVDDACGAATRELHDATVNNFKRLLGMVMSTEEVLSVLRQQ